MIKRIPTHCNDITTSSCVIAGDYIFVAHHAGGFDKKEIAHQMRATFESLKMSLSQCGATLNDMVQIHLYLKDLADFDMAREVFHEYFDTDSFPARMTSTSSFLNSECLCMVDGIAYKQK